jgi:hypothetical protein
LDFDAVVTSLGGRNGVTYGDTMTIIGDRGATTVPVSRWPNPNNQSPGIADGSYFGKWCNKCHKKGTKPGIRINYGNPIPTNGPNPAQNNRPFADGVNIHCGFSPDRRGSEGCVTIDPAFCQDVWDVLNPQGEQGVITITK